MDHRQEFVRLKTDLDQQELIKVTKYDIKDKTSKQTLEKAKSMGVPSSLIRFYEQIKSFELNWEMNRSPDPDVLGRVNILSLAAIIDDWHDVVYFDTTDRDDTIRDFHPFDYFVNEACVGIYLGESQDNSLYVYYFEDEPYRLDIDIDGYIQLMVDARGFRYWQSALLSMKGVEATSEPDRFKEYMPHLFPDFSYESFTRKYESMRR